MEKYIARDKEVKETIEKACEYITVEFTKLLDVKMEYINECQKLNTENDEMYHTIDDANRELNLMTDKLQRIKDVLEFADSNPALAVKLIRMIVECPF